MLAKIRPGTFVSEFQTTTRLRSLLLTIIIILWHIPVILGQQVWPGDINNNGIVNNIDVLYWAVAKDATGSGRSAPTAGWIGQDLPEVLWNQNFPGGLNFAYADCDGDGDVDDDDKAVIEANFGEVHDIVTPDEFLTGNPETDPVLLLSSGTTTIPPGGLLEADLQLGDETDTIADFYGIAFTLAYDPDAVATQGNSIQLDILPDTWMNGMGDDKVIKFLHKDPDGTGFIYVAIVRKNHQPASGFGGIGTFSIVMEDIVVGYAGSIGVTDIKMIDLNLAEMPVADSDLDFQIDTTITATDQPVRKRGIKLYPNPATGPEVVVETEHPEEKIRRIQLYDATGQLLQDYSAGSRENRCRLAVSQYPQGIYTFKIYTDKHLYVRSFFK